MRVSNEAGQSMLGRVFDQYQNMMQVARCVREVARQQGVARPRLLELSRRNTGLAGYAPEIEIVRFATHEANQPTLTTPVRLPFADQAFDACLVTDAYEHIAPEQRPELLSEMVRVTRGVVLLACPMENEVVTRFDKLVFDFIWGKYAERFEPLDQHVDFGLEPLEVVMASLVDAGADDAIALPDNYVYRWIHQILIYFDLQHRQPFAEVFEPINRVYNERLADCDYREPCYRYLIVGATAPGLDLSQFRTALQARPETPVAVAEAEGALIEAFHVVDARAADRLRAAGEELRQLRDQVRQARSNYTALEKVYTEGVNWLRSERAREAAGHEAALARLNREADALRERLALLEAAHAKQRAENAALQASHAELAARHQAYANSRAGRLVQLLWRLSRVVRPWQRLLNS